MRRKLKTKPIEKIIFVGGGSAGHIMPIIALVEALAERDDALKYKLFYIGQKKDLELANFDIEVKKISIQAGKLNRYVTWRHIKELVGFCIGVVQSFYILNKIKPDLIFAKGGFVCVPVVWVASQLGIPVYAHETDVRAGLANRMIARSARKVFTAFPEEYYSDFPLSKAIYTGQPVRRSFYAQTKENFDVNDLFKSNVELPIITIVGGSLGARKINELIADLYQFLLPSYRMIHICGKAEFASMQKIVKNNVNLDEETQKNLCLLPFTDQMSAIYQCSDLVISRSGGSIFELAALKKACILIPLSTSAQNHQNANAEVLEKAEAAIVLDENKLDPKTLLAEINFLMDNFGKRTQLQQNIALFAKPNAAKDIVNYILK